MLADLCASPDLMDAFAPFLVASELPLCPLLGASKALRRAYLEVARETGLLRIVTKMSEASEMEYSLHWQRLDPIEEYVDDDGAVRQRPIEPRLPLAWTVRITTADAGDMIVAHGVPCLDLWKRSAMVLAAWRGGDSFLRNVVPYAILDDWPTCMAQVDDGSNNTYDLTQLVCCLGLGVNLEEFWTYFIVPVLATKAQLYDATIRLRVHSEFAGLARLGVEVES